MNKETLIELLRDYKENKAKLNIKLKELKTARINLKSNDFVNMEPGVYEIEGKDIYAQVFDAETGSVEEKRPDSHKNYLDVQFLASGEEKLGFTPLKYEYVVERSDLL